MATRRRTNATSTQLATLSQRAPYVVAQRLARMANPTPTARDQQDLQRMGLEKIAAIQEGWMAMTTEMLAQQHRAWVASWQAAFTPWKAESPLQWWYRGLSDADAVMAAGLRPATRRVAANARRLSAAPRK